MILTLKEIRKVCGKVTRIIPQEKTINRRLPYCTYTFDTNDGYLENYRQYYDIREYKAYGERYCYATLKNEYNENRPTYQFTVHYKLYEVEMSEDDVLKTLEHLSKQYHSLEKRMNTIEKLVDKIGEAM